MKKLGVYFLVAMLMVSFALGSVSNNAYAEIPKKIGIGNLTEDDLVAAWYFDEDNGDVVKDYKGNYDGIANGTTIVDTFYGKSQNFDGVDDYIELSNPIIPIGKKSIRFRIKVSECKDGIIFDNTGIYFEANGDMVRVLPNGFLRWSSFKGVPNEREEYRYNLISTKSIADDKWHDILLTWDGTINDNTVEMYIDDMEEPHLTTTATEIGTNSPTNNLRMGVRYDKKIDNKELYFKGILDEIEIYNKAYIPPSAPKNLTATPGNKKVDLSWDEVDNAQSYTIKRSTTEGGPYEIIAENILGTSYTDEGLDNGTTYYYVICAVQNGAPGPDSGEEPGTPESSSGSGDNALLRITMSNGKINEYDLSMSDVEDFIDWYEDRANDKGKPYYIMEKDYNIGPFENRKDYITFDKILQFEVMEYNK